MIYELINPSDDYTFEAASDGIAAIVAGMCGRGYGATRDDWQCGPFLFGDIEQTIKDYLGGATAEEFIAAHEADIAIALLSFRIGDRRDYPTDDAGIDKKMDDRRTSLNNIGNWARRTGEAMLRHSAARATAESSVGG